MNTTKLLSHAALLLAVAFAASACDYDSDEYYEYSYVSPTAIVTVKPASDSLPLRLQLDDSTALRPVNLPSSPFGDKEVRALVGFVYQGGTAPGGEREVWVNWIDSVLTKPMAESLGQANDSVYGDDPVEIVDSWETVAEDGYLTLRFRTKWGNSGIAHRVNLLTGVNPDDPYEVEFRHDAEGDDERKWGDGLVAFSLKDLPDTEGKTVTLKLRWQSYSGTKQANFKFCSRKTTESANLLHGSPKFVTEIE